MKAKKFRKFDEGGLTEGPNANIDDDTRARAMEFVRRRLAGEDSDSAPAAAAPRARPKAVVVATKSAPAPASKPSAPAEDTVGANEVPSVGRYKQDTYETPLKSAVRRMAPDVMDNLGKITAGLGTAAAAYGAGSKLLNATNAADKVRKEASLVAGNARNASRMKDVVVNATKKAAEAPALKKANQGLSTRMEVAKSTAKGKADRARRSQQGITTEKDEQGFYRSGGSVSRGDGCAQRGKTKGKMR